MKQVIAYLNYDGVCNFFTRELHFAETLNRRYQVSFSQRRKQFTACNPRTSKVILHERTLTVSRSF